MDDLTTGWDGDGGAGASGDSGIFPPAAHLARPGKEERGEGPEAALSFEEETGQRQREPSSVI